MAVQFLDTVIQQLTRYVITVVNQISVHNACLFMCTLHYLGDTRDALHGEVSDRAVSP